MRQGKTQTFGAAARAALFAATLAAALLLAPGTAQARDECGALDSNGAATCSNAAYTSGIRYDVNNGWGNGIAGDITLRVTGGAATAITSATATGWGSGIVLRTNRHASETRTIDLTVGSGSNNVDITQSAATITGGFDDTGVVLHHQAIGASPTTATLGGGVDIGTSSAPMQRSGIHVLVENGGNTGDHTITSGATIHSTAFGIIMDNRGAGDTEITNSGSITTTETGGSASDKSGIRILDWSHNPAGGSYGGDSRTADTTATVTNSGSIAVSAQFAHGVQVDAMGLGLYKIVNSGSGTKGITASGADGHGVMVAATWHTGAAGSTAVEIENSGRITASGANGFGIYVETVGATGLTATQHKGDIEITNSGSISSSGNHAVIVNANMGAVSVTHSGGSIASSAFDGIRIHQGGTGAATVASGADVKAKRWGVFVDQLTSAGAASVTHSAGAIAAETESGVHAQNAAGNAAKVEVMVTGGSVKSDGQSKAAVSILQRGTGDAVAGVSEGATLTSKHNAGIYADLSNGSNAAGQIKITQGGTISGRKGVYARVGRVSAQGETRAAADQPAIDIAWTGAFARGTGTAENDDDRFLARDVAHAVAVAQEVEAEKAMRYGQAAGVEAQVMSWRAVMTAVAKGDDPGEITDAAATLAGEGGPAIRAAFRAVLANADLDEIPGAAAINTDGTAGLSNAEIDAYLTANPAVLRNALAQGLSDAEKAVLRAATTNTGLEAALEGVAGAADAWKDEVRALLARFNAGDIRIAVNGGSIDSRGDGVRAYYATPHAANGGIDVTVAEGAEVTGAMAGVYVSGAGRGAGGVLDQSVTVNGTVTGGTDAAVHLVGGGSLTVGEKGRVLAGSSGRAVLVNEPGPAAIVIHGTVRGGAGADAAVHLTGGGSVTVGRSGSVDANGADAAIRGEGAATTVTIHMEGRTREDVEAASGRVTGAITGSGVRGVTFSEVDEDGETGFSQGAPVKDGAIDLSGVLTGGGGALAILTLEGCAAGSDKRCRIYEALPSALLMMNRMPSFAERASAPRASNGAWGSLEFASGEWTADKAATGKAATGDELAYDYSRFGGRAGFDFIGRSSRVGLSVHVMKGTAELDGEGEIALNGMGFGASLTWTGGDFYVDAQLQATWLDAEIDADMSGKLEKEATGHGFGLGVEVGTRAAIADGLFLTPRAALTLTTADLGDFTDDRGADPARVSVEDAQSSKGRLGVMVDAPMADGGGLFATLDLEQEFSNETSVEVSNLKLKTETPATAFRLGVGGAFSLGEGVAVRLSGHYETSGSGASEFGGGASLSVSF